MKKYFYRFYVKHILKSGVLFFAFLALGLLTFILISLHIKIDITESYSAHFSDNKIIVGENIYGDIEHLYLYKVRNEKVFHCGVSEKTHFENSTIFYIDENSIGNMSGNVKIDIVTGSESLLKYMFKSIGED